MIENPRGDKLKVKEAQMQLLRQGRLFGELVATAGWKELERILESHCNQRLHLLTTPLHELRRNTQDGTTESMDGVTAIASQESIKGVLIGLRLALSIPHNTIAQSRDLQSTILAEDTGAPSQ